MTEDDSALCLPGGDAWTWTYEGYDPDRERLREALCTLANGYLATRGAAPETWEPGPAHYPGTYVAGCYNRLGSHVAGRDVENEDLVNLPNWLPLRLRVRGDTDDRHSPWLSPDTCEVEDYRLSLHLRDGTLTRRMRLRDDAGRVTTVHQTRLVHMGEPHLAALRTEVTAENWSGTVEAESRIEGDVRNTGVERYRKLADRHLTDWSTGTEADGVMWLRCRTGRSGIRVALAARTTGPWSVDARRRGDRSVDEILRARLDPGGTVTLDKTVGVYTSPAGDGDDPTAAAIGQVRDAAGFIGLLTSHSMAWMHLWQSAQLEVPGQAGRILRLHLFHVLQTLSPHTAALDVGVPARGLHGEAYRGHVFWDELFVLPYLNLHFPDVSRALLYYRHRRLGQAVRNAAAAGRRGAMYPWQSGSDGREETQTYHLNPRSGRWLPDHSHLQHHVGSAVAYNVWQYAQATGDTGFLHGPGAEMLLQIARFWADGAAWDRDRGRYRIRGVMGPDEYHDAYPGAERPGIDDNAFTNVTAAWVLCRALQLLGDLPDRRRRELTEQLALDAAETDRWEEVSRRLYVPWHHGVIGQFEGYAELEELDWDGYRARYGDIHRLDRILEAEDDRVTRYQASKQADALMLGYLFPARRLADLFARLGYRLDDEVWRATTDYYLARTSHGSTLSSLVHGWVLARAHREEGWAHVRRALLSDVADVQGGTTPEGIHLGAMAGTLDLVQRGLTGLEADEDALRLAPVPVSQLPQFELSVRYRDRWDVHLRLRDGCLHVGVPLSSEEPLTVEVGGRTVRVPPGNVHSLDLRRERCQRPGARWGHG
jgi:trehalose/maltose hydrolase-like predicted phosphorylase